VPIIIILYYMLDSEWHRRCVIVIWVILLRGAFDPYIILYRVSTVVVFRTPPTPPRAPAPIIHNNNTDVYNIIQAKLLSLSRLCYVLFLILKNRDWTPRSWVIRKVPILISHTNPTYSSCACLCVWTPPSVVVAERDGNGK